MSFDNAIEKEIEYIWQNIFTEDDKIIFQFDNINIKQYHIDTRDFRCLESNKSILNEQIKEKDRRFDYDIIKKYPHFFHKPEEVKTLIERLYNESGGKGKWRMLCLDNYDERITGWNLKYIRIYLVPEGLVVCNAYNKAIPKEILNNKVEKKYLNHY